MASIPASSLDKEALVPGTKRKRTLIHTDKNALGAAFTIRGHSLSSDDGGVTITPQLLILRSALPLTFLAPQDENYSIPRVFQGNVGPLEAADQQRPGRETPSVLIAVRKCAEHTMYAIERVAKGVYVLCRLASWVQLEDFEGAVYWSEKAKRPRGDVAADCFDKSRTLLGTQPHGGPKIPTDHRRIPSQRVRLLMKPPSETTCTKEELPNVSPLEQAVEPLQLPVTKLIYQEDLGRADPAPATNIDEVLENLKRQYLEALYNSKASLAYFAKGPLSRPRGLLLQEGLSRPSSERVSEALRSCILSRSMLDTKYSTTIPHLVKDIPLGIASDDEQYHVPVPSLTKPRKPKKRKKLGKNGLFPGEEEYLRSWYARSNRAQMDDNQLFSREERVKSAIAGQRSRETQMQIAIILEIIALELSPPLATCTGSTALPERVDQDCTASKITKSQNLSELVDVLVERLCIWQSTDLDLNEPSKTESKEVSQLEQQSVSTRKSSNSLEDFCTQVIVPFYAAQLPDVSASICRNLGVSMGPSPKRPPLARTTSGIKRNDAEASRKKLLKRRKTLERVLTDDRLTRPGPTASLVRSNTDSAIPRIKREASEVSLSEVPVAKGLKAMPRQYSQREVDLAAVSRVAEARLQRKQLIEQEKNAAIALLKKPNARMAVVDLVESKDQREAGAKARSRKSKNPVRIIFAQGVQVTATPQSNRHKDIFQPLPKLNPTRYEPSPEPEAIPPLSDPRVPASSIKPTGGVGPYSQETPIKGPASMNAMRLPFEGVVNSGLLVPPYHNTPAKTLSSSLVPRVPLSVVKENVERRTGCAETPSRAQGGKRTTISFSKEGHSDPLAVTPSRTLARKMAASTPLWSGKASEKAIASTPSKGQKSIYESLGWDMDDVDDLV